MRSYFIIIIFLFILISCSSYSKEFEISGNVTKIEGNMISIDGDVIKVEKGISKLKVGQKVKVTLIDNTPEDDWDPDDFTVKNIQIIK